MNEASKPERILSAQVTSILGIPVQTVQEMAARRLLPSATKIDRHWTFNEKAIRKWLRAREAAHQFAAKVRQEWLDRVPPVEAYELAIGRKPSQLRSDDAPAKRAKIVARGEKKDEE